MAFRWVGNWNISIAARWRMRLRVELKLDLWRPRHCERSEAIQYTVNMKLRAGLLRYARNDGLRFT
jgi:hypothetical protein